MARDCRGRGDPNLAKNNSAQFDSEYSALMAELGESATGVAQPSSNPNQIPPWRMPENWNTNSKSLLAVNNRDSLLMSDFKGVGQAPGQGGYQQGGQGGYGYGAEQGGYQQAGYGGGDPNAAAAYGGGYGGQAAPGGADPYAS